MKTYGTFREAIKIIIDASGGQRKVVGFEIQNNRWWVFELDNGIRVKMLAI